jgi:hypothetical protein
VGYPTCIQVHWYINVFDYFGQLFCCYLLVELQLSSGSSCLCCCYLLGAEAARIQCRLAGPVTGWGRPPPAMLRVGWVYGWSSRVLEGVTTDESGEEDAIVFPSFQRIGTCYQPWVRGREQGRHSRGMVLNGRPSHAALELEYRKRFRSLK